MELKMTEPDDTLTPCTDPHADRLSNPESQNPLFFEPFLRPQFFSYAQTAEIFGKSPRTIRLWVKLGHLNATRIGGARLISEAEIRRLAGGTAPAATDVTTPSTSESEGQ
jgi:excisionase family DNA binding protein